MTIERLQRTCNLARNTQDADRWTAEQWLVLHDAYTRSGWDITPDFWTRRQISDALNHGKAPQWNGKQEPVYFDRFITVGDNTYCAPCAVARGIKLDNPHVEVWQVGSSGWTASPAPCADCGAPIQVEVL